jgi:hypothetical protein
MPSIDDKTTGDLKAERLYMLAQGIAIRTPGFFETKEPVTVLPTSLSRNCESLPRPVSVRTLAKRKRAEKQDLPSISISATRKPL